MLRESLCLLGFFFPHLKADITPKCRNLESDLLVPQVDSLVRPVSSDHVMPDFPAMTNGVHGTVCDRNVQP